jgi:hypothetical protein
MKVCGKFQGLSNPSGCLISVPDKIFVFAKDDGAAERIEASVIWALRLMQRR